MTLNKFFLKIYNFILKNKIHFIAWGCFIIYEVFITGLIMGSFGQPGAYVISYVLAISFFYLHAFILKATIKQKNVALRILTILFIVIIELSGYLLASFLLKSLFHAANLIVLISPLTINQAYLSANVWRCLYIIGFGTGYFYILKSLENTKIVEELKRKSLLDQIERHSLENSLIQTQNNYLRSQINPHFLFNTLNFIYNDARKKAPVAAEAIMNLSEMMRYALKRNEALEVVPIIEEIAQIEHLIELHKLRTKNAVNLDFIREGELMGVRFPPLILLTLVENLFKHGNILHLTKPAIISLKRIDNILYIKFCNLIGPIQKNNDNSHKVGVLNTKTRLENIYKSHCTFNIFIDSTKETYTTEITVDLAFTPKKY